MFTGILGCKEREESNNLNMQKTKYYDSSANRNNEKGDCDYLYYLDGAASYKKRTYIIVLGCFISVLDIALAIFGFFIFKDGGSSSGTPL